MVTHDSNHVNQNAAGVIEIESGRIVRDQAPVVLWAASPVRPSTDSLTQ